MHDWKKFRISSEPSEGPKPAIQLPPDHVIGSTAQMQRLARLLIYIDVPRREVKDWITNTMHGFEGYVVDGRGRDFVLDDDELEAAFNEANDKDKKDYRWISDFWKWADRAPRQRAQARVVERLRYMTAAAAVYEFQYGAFDDSISSLNPFHRLDDFEEIEDAIAFREKHRFFFLAGYEIRDRFGDGPVYRRMTPILMGRSFTLAAVASRYARWLLTYLYPISRKRFAVWLISK